MKLILTTFMKYALDIPPFPLKMELVYLIFGKFYQKLTFCSSFTRPKEINKP